MRAALSSLRRPMSARSRWYEHLACQQDALLELLVALCGCLEGGGGVGLVSFELLDRRFQLRFELGDATARRVQLLLQAPLACEETLVFGGGTVELETLLFESCRLGFKLAFERLVALHDIGKRRVVFAQALFMLAGSGRIARPGRSGCCGLVGDETAFRRCQPDFELVYNGRELVDLVVMRSVEKWPCQRQLYSAWMVAMTRRCTSSSSSLYKSARALSLAMPAGLGSSPRTSPPTSG